MIKMWRKTCSEIFYVNFRSEFRNGDIKISAILDNCMQSNVQLETLGN